MHEMKNKVKSDIQSGQTALGIEFGSTRIKAVLIDSTHSPIASGSYEWENQLEGGIWTYSLETVWEGMQVSYQRMSDQVQQEYGETLQTIGSIGFSAMMHGYLAFDRKGELLVPFRTWRNAITEQAEKELTEAFHFNIPQRWSIAHLYQAILNEEEHVSKIDFLTTLAGYVHWKLTGKKTLGIGDASGMFPIDIESKNFDQQRIAIFNTLVSGRNNAWTLENILPKVSLAGKQAGSLTEEGAKLLDRNGLLQSGIPVCPPEGDAGSGMVATNSVRQRTGNVSAGTSVFAMIVLEKSLKTVYPEIDLVTTPSGSLVGMVHANNCSSDINAWVNLFEEFILALSVEIDKEQIFDLLFKKVLEGDADCGGLLSYGYFSGENITNMKEGRPLFVRTPESNFSLANFMRVHLYSAFGALKIGMDILQKEEQVQLDKVLGHGGIFKTKDVGQKMMAAAMNVPISVMKTAGEGGAWGMALLASYMQNRQAEETLAEYLECHVFKEQLGITVEPDEKDVKGFNQFMKRYKKGLSIEQTAIDYL